jgi:hypothetical protein
MVIGGPRHPILPSVVVEDDKPKNLAFSLLAGKNLYHPSHPLAVAW